MPPGSKVLNAALPFVMINSLRERSGIPILAGPQCAAPGGLHA